jgi:hypothetical protein
MKLEARASAQSQFVSQHNIPSVQAFSDTSVILAAYIEALGALLVLCENAREDMYSSLYENYATLASVRREMDNDLMTADVMLEAIQAKLAI